MQNEKCKMELQTFCNFHFSFLIFHPFYANDFLFGQTRTGSYNSRKCPPLKSNV